MHKKILTLGTFVILYLVSQSVNAGWREGSETSNSNFCGNYSFDTSSLCQGKSISRAYARGKRAAKLDCSSGSQSKIRKMAPINEMAKWLDDLSIGDKEAAFNIRQDEAPFTWQGSITYDVVEEWSYYSCESITDFKCGSYRDCRKVEYEVSRTTDEHGRTTVKTAEKTECSSKQPATCMGDVLRRASMKCSSQQMNYTGEYIKDMKWGVDSSGYHDLIPNKYDLLPGENERLTLNLHGGSSLNQTLSFSDDNNPNYNEYDIRYSGSAMGARCEEGVNPELHIKIATIRRIKRNSPNAFVLPIDMEGNSVEPLIFAQKVLDKGVAVNSHPVSLRLSDVSAGIVEVTADNSYDIDKSEDTKLAKQHPFFKNTKMKLQLVEDKWYGDSHHSAPVHIDDAQAVASMFLSLSEIDEVANSEFWNIPLNSEKFNIYKRDNFIARALGLTKKMLKPGARYLLRVSMYQKGMPFYHALCDEKTIEKGIECTDAEEDVYSKPLDIAFRARVDVDERTTYEKINQWTLIDWLNRDGKCENDEIGCKESE